MKFSLSLVLAFYSALSWGSLTLNQLAPDFKLQGQDGKTYALSDFKGKTVVLEWFGHECPFVRKHYDSKNMQRLQEKYQKAGVVWLAINSSAKGKGSYLENFQKAKEQFQNEGMKAQALLLDSQGLVGRSYEAKTTPHLFIINSQGLLVYQGAIDSIRSTDTADVARAKNYVAPILDQLVKGENPKASQTTPYGCGVKY